MSEAIQVTGVVLSAMPVGEYDRRVVLLTKELGRITAFARGARRQNSPLMAATNAFVFAHFTVYQGRSSYTLAQAQVSHYFIELAGEMPEVYYGFYFLEVADYFGTENTDETNMVNLLFVTLRALLKKKVDRHLIRAVYELKSLVHNGVFAVDVTECPNETVLYTLQYIVSVSVEKLYSFSLDEESMRCVIRLAKRHMERCIDRPCKSLDILESID